MSTIKDELLEPYYIKSDSNGGFILIETKTVKSGKNTGKTEDENISYPSTLPSAVMFIIKLKLHKEGGQYTLSEYYNKLTDIYNKITDKLKLLG